MQHVFDAGTPGFDVMAKTYHDFEGPHFKSLADGRQVRLEARGIMLGGVIHWATLASPEARFTTVVVQEISLHDAPLADSDRKAVEGWDLAAMLACIDGRLWPG